MKPAPFEYVAPETLADALALVGDDARPLAGGQSLVPLLNLRRVRPRLLVDLNGIAELTGIRSEDGRLSIGALTRQAELERSDEVGRGWPILREAVKHVAHAAIRSRGTVGGSVAHADPSAQLPCVLAALDARFHVRSARGARTLAAEELFRAPYTTCLEADELLVELVLPAIPAGVRSGFAEFSRTHASFPVACVAVVGDRIAVAVAGQRLALVRSIAEAPVVDPYRDALVAELYRRALA